MKKFLTTFTKNITFEQQHIHTFPPLVTRTNFGTLHPTANLQLTNYKNSDVAKKRDLCLFSTNSEEESEATIMMSRKSPA